MIEIIGAAESHERILVAVVDIHLPVGIPLAKREPVVAVRHRMTLPHLLKFRPPPVVGDPLRPPDEQRKIVAPLAHRARTYEIWPLRLETVPIIMIELDLARHREHIAFRRENRYQRLIGLGVRLHRRPVRIAGAVILLHRPPAGVFTLCVRRQPVRSVHKRAVAENRKIAEFPVVPRIRPDLIHPLIIRIGIWVRGEKCPIATPHDFFRRMFFTDRERRLHAVCRRGLSPRLKWGLSPNKRNDK